MKPKTMLALAAGAVALGLSFSAPQAAMPILDAAQGVDAGTLVLRVQSAKARCWPPYRDCRYQCIRQHKNLVARQNCLDRCAGAYRRCIGR
jgi:hypothetical protein